MPVHMPTRYLEVFNYPFERLDNQEASSYFKWPASEKPDACMYLPYGVKSFKAGECSTQRIAPFFLSKKSATVGHYLLTSNTPFAVQRKLRNAFPILYL